MLANRTKVESKAINVIRDLVDLSDRLLPDPNFGDKGISTDGFIQLFKNENVDIGENLLRQIPIQIKGRTDKTKKLTHIHKNSFKENVAVKDLENYSRFGGAIYFYVYFNNSFEIHSVYYSVLMPVKCRSYLTVAQKANTKEVAVSFTKLEETGRAIYEICAQFYEEQKKQGFGDGAIIEHIVSWNDLKGETTLSASAVGATDMVDFFKRIVVEIFIYMLRLVHLIFPWNGLKAELSCSIFAMIFQ